MNKTIHKVTVIAIVMSCQGERQVVDKQNVEDKNTMSSEQSRTRGIVNKMGWGKARSGVVSRRGRGPECTGW